MVPRPTLDETDKVTPHPHSDGVDPAPPHVAPHAGAGALRAPRPMVRGLGELRLLAINHHTATLSRFERAALGPDELVLLYGRLEALGLDAVVLSTCNRIELYWRSIGHDADTACEEVFRQATGAAVEPGVLLRASGEQAAHHLFRVACGLDSLLLGEGEIMGQIRDALEDSGAGDFMAGVFRAALRCGGCARAETTIGSGALSVASAGAHLVVTGIAAVESPRVLVVGAGETGVKAARHLAAEGVKRLVIVNRTLERAEAAARELRAEAAPLEALPGLLRDADGVVVAAHAPAFLVTVDMVRQAQAARPNRALVLSDISMPRAIDAGVRAVPGVTLHDMLGLESLVRENRTRREREIPRVEAVIQRELEQLRSWAHQQLLRPLMADFRQRAEAIRLAELKRSAGEDLTDAEVVDRLTRRLVDRLIAIPIATMREAHPETFDVCGLQCLRRPPTEPTNGRG
jgi:glutamyl-tRNA reductase